MEPFHHDPETVRFSNSPRRSPQITQGLKSPVRSLHPQLQQGQSSQTNEDQGLRTLDFFDESSEDELNSPIDPANTAPNVEDLDRRGSASKKRHSGIHSLGAPLASQCQSKPVKLEPSRDGYQPLSPTTWNDAPTHQEAPRPGTPSTNTSFNGSVDELLPSHMHSSPPQFQRNSRISSGRTPRSSAHIERSDQRQGSAPPIRPKPTLGAYALAHEITLNALMRDEEALDKGLQSFALAPLQDSDRRSLLPAALSPSYDPRSPKMREFSSPATASSRRVQVLPPPIDVSDAGRRSIPDDIVRTPYPYGPDHVQRKDFGEHASLEPPAASNINSESILTLSIRRSHASSKPRVTTITIPASNDFTAVRNSGIVQKEQHFKALDLDDAELFRQLRAAYHRLAGPWRPFSARSLARIVVSGSDPNRTRASTGWVHEPRSPRELAFKGLNDTFGEDKLLEHFRRPSTVKSRYAFVHWAHRLAAAPTEQQQRERDRADESRDAELVRRIEQPEGLEFVVGWSPFRIISVLLLVLAISVAAALLWTLLGKNTTSGGVPAHAGFRGAGDRVTSGVLLGICLLLLGLSSMAGWLGLSWLIM